MNIDKKYNDVLQSFKSSLDNAVKLDTIRREGKYASILLFRDYLTRLRLWKKALEKDFESINRKDMDNLFLSMNYAWISDIKPLNLFEKDMEDMGTKFKKNRFYDGFFAYLYIYWEVFKDREEITQHHLPHPYEGIIKVILRGESIFVYGGQFEVGEIAFNNSAKYKYYRLPSIDSGFLNYIESKYDPSKTWKIPNQEETNQLWIEFQEINK